MKLKRAFGFCVVMLCGFFTSACFTIEKEIFLNADGSGELLLHVSVPDLPDDAKSTSAGIGKNPAEEIDKFKKNVMTKLPLTVKLKEAKQVKQNGVLSFYAVLEFKDLKDTENILSGIGNDGLDEFSKGQSQWSLQLDKSAGRTTYTEKVFLDMSASNKPASPPVSTKKSGPPRGRQNRKTAPQASTNRAAIDLNSPEFGEKMQLLVMSLVKMRFVLHAPSPISESNADIMLNQNRIAVWNCSLIRFVTDKHPVEMRAVF
jgi:hypothetical protein